MAGPGPLSSDRFGRASLEGAQDAAANRKSAKQKVFAVTRSLLSSTSLRRHVYRPRDSVLHIDRNLAVFTQIGLGTRRSRLGKLEGSDRCTSRAIPQFGDRRFDNQDADLWIVRPSRPPNRICLAPRRCSQLSIIHDLRLTGYG